MTDDHPTGPQLIALKNQIVAGFNESHWKELGMLTDMYERITRHPRLLRSLSWDDPDYEGNVLQIVKDIIDADPKNQAILYDFVARTCPEAGVVVSCQDDGARRIVFVPSVFKVPSERPDINLVSVMMPFSPSFNPVFETIKEAARTTAFSCKRADDIWNDSTVIQDVFSLIFQSYIVVCDFSGKNPNVFYEAGIAHTLGKHVIPITQNPDDIPFDLRHHRYAKYLNNAEGRTVLQAELEARLNVLSQRKHQAQWA